MKPLIECVANFSEGRRSDVMDAILESIERAGGVYLLDSSHDIDHNRMVVTFAGLPEEVAKSAFAGIQKAAEHIDLNKHQGVHPRFGAADVIPFIPLRDTSMAECIEVARYVGRRVAEELELPVYFYDQAAMRPENQDLANIRTPSFQYEHLREAIGTDPRWVPDMGPAELGAAGAVLLGARRPLIAFNIYLNTDDLDIAKSIAAAVRYSSGGLRDVKSAGFLVADRAQVSLNLSNHEQTPLHRVFELIRREAAQHGVVVHSSELIGLIPQQALIDSAAWYWQLKDFDANRILENRIAQAESALAPLGEEEPPVPEDATFHVVLPPIDDARRPEQLVAAVAQATAAPGGGASLSTTGALAAALTEMVAGLTIGKKGYANVEENMLAIQSTAFKLRDALLDTVGQDIDAVSHLMATIRQAKSLPDGGEEAIQEATLAAADVPLHTARLIFEVLQLLEQVTEKGNHNAAIDAAVGANLALAALESAALNVRANLMGITDATIVARYTDEIRHMLSVARPLCPRIVALACERIGLTEEL